tara:strand:- start:1665 stop:1835 length:171 start_codon:yes stop_codon:yes gene_type:complete
MFMLSACSIPKNPSISFGKKCQVGKGQITYSYVWMYDKEEGLNANEKDCELIEPKD